MVTANHNNLPIERQTLYVLWRKDREEAAPRPLRDWIADYPTFADDLGQWASELPLLESAYSLPGEAAEVARLGRVGRAVVAEMRAKYGMARTPLNSLAEGAKRRGLRLPEVAKRLGVGMPIVSKLDQRLLQFATLPDALLQKLAETLEVSLNTVQDYLRQPPTLASSAAYRYTGDAAPQVLAQESFEDAIRGCPGMSEAQKTLWLNAPEG